MSKSQFLDPSAELADPGEDVSAQHQEAPLYCPSSELIQAVRLALALRRPLLLTGPSGHGKTSAAYWAAWQLNVASKDLLHIHVRSTTSADELKYQFDAVSYLREAQLSALAARSGQSSPAPEKEQFIRKGKLWLAFEQSKESPVVLLIDEIDKAPRDVPNDLLHEMERLEFEVADLPDASHRPTKIQAARPEPDFKKGLLLCIITSNRERDLPDAFVRRCLHCHITLTREEMEQALARRELKVSPHFLKYALDTLERSEQYTGGREPGLS